MKPNLLNEDLRVNEKWLEQPMNKCICKFLAGWLWYLDDLKEYNEDFEEIKKDTDIVSIFSTLRIVEFKEGIIIEDLTDDSYYSLTYISYEENKEIEILKTY